MNDQKSGPNCSHTSRTFHIGEIACAMHIRKNIDFILKICRLIQKWIEKNTQIASKKTLKRIEQPGYFILSTFIHWPHQSMEGCVSTAIQLPVSITQLRHSPLQWLLIHGLQRNCSGVEQLTNTRLSTVRANCCVDLRWHFMKECNIVHTENNWQEHMLLLMEPSILKAYWSDLAFLKASNECLHDYFYFETLQMIAQKEKGWLLLK